ncbi:MAG: phosphatase PAP2 family protein [Magnetococcales bacterium]|nr:phosphatase PAP2 family protein [Magnetococcales bacterium]
MTRKPSLAWSLILLLLVMLLAEFTTLDLRVQDFFYREEIQSWIVDKDAFWPRMLFYVWPKWLVVLVAIGTLIALGLVWKRRLPMRQRRPLILLLACLILVPGVISGMKNITNVHCPWSLSRYGGSLPFVPLLATQPDDFPAVRPGKCFPAGHPSGGFAFMVLYHLLPTRRQRWLGLGAGLTLGWIMGLYQMMKGAHFPSHVLVSMLLSWLIIAGAEAMVSRRWPDPRPQERS